MLSILWNDILQGLEPGREKNPTTAVLCGVDFSKSFSRCSHQEILQAYRRLEAPQWIINMHAAFLKGQKMRVKVGSVLSEDVDVTGGAVQGSILGIMEHNATLEEIDEEITIKSEKYVEAMTLYHPIKCKAPAMIEEDGTYLYRATASKRDLRRI